MRDRLVPPAPLAGRLRRAPGLSGLLGAAGPVGLSAYSFFSNSGITLGPGDTVEGWQGGGQFPIELVPVSTAPVLADNVVEFSEASRLGYDLQTPLDLPGGFSAWLLMRVPDPAVLTGSRRAFRLLNSSSAAQLQVIFPNAAGQVLMNAGGTNVVASGLTDQELSEFAVWGFEWNAYNDTARITRNGVVVSAAPTGTVGPIIDYARPEVGVGSTIHVARALMYVEPRTVAEAEIISTLQQSSFAASFAPQTVAHDAGVVALGTIATAGNIGAIAIVGGPITDQPGDNGGTFTVPDNLSVTFDATALAAALADGAQLTTSVTLQLRDALGQTVNVPLDVTVSRIDDAPVAAGALADLVLTQGQAMAPVDVSGDFTDAGDTLSFAAAGLPAGLVLSGAGQLTGTATAAGTFNVVVTATDTAGQTAQSGFTITVNAVVGALSVTTFANMNSLYDHSSGGDDAKVPVWQARYALEAGNTFAANAGFDTMAIYPPLSTFGSAEVADPGYDGSLASFESIAWTQVCYTSTNFRSGGPPTAGTPGPGTPDYDEILAQIDRVEAGQPGLAHRVHFGWPDMGPFGDPAVAPLTAQEWSDYKAWARGGYATWTRQFMSTLKAARPALDIDVIDCNDLFVEILDNELSALGSNDLFIDSPPHGTPTTYALAGAIFYRAQYGVLPPLSYTFPVSVNAAVQSNWAAIRTRIENFFSPPVATVPGAPTALVATDGEDGQSSLSWAAPASDGGSPIAGYRIERDAGGGFAALVANTGTASTAYLDTTAVNGTTYAYRVLAINGVGTGPASNVDTGTPQAPAGFNPTSLSPHVLFDLQTAADLEVDPRAVPIVQASADGRVGGVQNAGISTGGTYTADINPGTLVGAGRLWFPNANDNFVEERPTLRSAGGVEYLDFGAGESGKWHWASTPFTDTLYALLAFRYSATGLVDYDRLLSFDLQDGTAFDNFSAGHAAFVMNTGTPNRLTLNIGGAEDLTIGAPAAGTDLVAELIIAPTGNEIAIDGGTPVQNATNYGARLSDRFILMNDRSGNGIEGRVHGLFVRNSVPSGTERAQLVTYFGALQGRVI